MEDGRIWLLSSGANSGDKEVKVVVELVDSKRLFKVLVEVRDNSERDASVPESRKGLVRVRNHLPVGTLLKPIPQFIGNTSEGRQLALVASSNKHPTDKILPPLLGRHAVVPAVVWMILFLLLDSGTV